MDKKTIIGLVLMIAVFIGFSMYQSGEAEKYQKWQHEQKVQAQKRAEAERLAKSAEQQKYDAMSEEEKEALRVQQEWERANKELVKYGETLHEALNRGAGSNFTVTNDVLAVEFSPRGGKIVGVTLLDEKYTRYEKDVRDEQVQLIYPGTSYFGVELRNGDNLFDTDSFVFDSSVTEVEGATVVTMSLVVDKATGARLDYVYTIHNTGNLSRDYLVDFDVKQHNLQPYITKEDEMMILWRNQTMQNEHNRETEDMATTIIYYDAYEDEMNELDSQGKHWGNHNVRWFAYKQQYFTSAFFTGGSIHVDMHVQKGNTGNALKNFASEIFVPFSAEQPEYNFAFYFGPNDFRVMENVVFKGMATGIEEIIPMGGWLVGWFNRWITIPIFTWLSENGLGFGLIILILTIIVKLIILPLTYKSYMSTAKMRAVRPEMEEINKKYPKKEDAMKKQQATMELYRKAGISPMGGCLPLLIQMPILWAMFRFFPASIELRGESFLWADDLSSYDSIIDLPFNIPFYGDHISLFALLMAASLFGYSYFTYKQQSAATAGQPGGGVMKFMMVYFMPVMMLFFFNSYSSGLCYYYFLSQMLTMLIMYIIRRSVDDEKVRAKLLANAAKPRKKSKFQERYEEMLRQQQEQMNREQRRQKH